MSIPKLKAPNLLEADLSVFELSGSQLIFPLPESICDDPEQAAHQIDLYDDSKNYVGNPAIERYIQILSCDWDYIVESSSQRAGGAFLLMFVHPVDDKSKLQDKSVLDSSVLKQWILYKEGSEFEEINKRKKARAEFVEREFHEEELCSYPKSMEELSVYLENGTPKCHIKSGDPKMPRLDNSLYIPVSKNHVLNIRIDFGGFSEALMGSKEETDKLLDGYAKEFFSHVRVNYNDELKKEVAELYNIS